MNPNDPTASSPLPAAQEAPGVVDFPRALQRALIKAIMDEYGGGEETALNAIADALDDAYGAAALSAPSAPVEAIPTAWLISYADQSTDLCFTEEEADELVADAKPGATKTPLAALSALQAAPVQQQTWRPTHRHVKTGGEYMLLGIGKMQAGKWKTPTIRPDDCGQKRWVHVSIDMREVAIYRGADGSLWARPVEEFNDGRFAPLPTNSEASSNG